MRRCASSPFTTASSTTASSSLTLPQKLGALPLPAQLLSFLVKEFPSISLPLSPLVGGGDRTSSEITEKLHDADRRDDDDDNDDENQAADLDSLIEMRAIDSRLLSDRRASASSSSSTSSSSSSDSEEGHRIQDERSRDDEAESNEQWATQFFPSISWNLG